ncbi:hypothetical protein HHK36_012591 [Tetracentron sinense]|uniref:Sodium/calcium exchanger membrane region domain-containing protein n=1 Tax=Tetracentron sinense TaxID=13715 RepID=A0A834Z739_TETSI|nr:hypothetical protein HHK36_012591 [Tetracentron sinense]
MAFFSFSSSIKTSAISLILLSTLIFFLISSRHSPQNSLTNSIIPHRSLLNTSSPSCSSILQTPPDQRCSFSLTHCNGDSNGLFNYSSLHFCIFSEKPFISIPFLSLIIILQFYFLVKTAQDRFSVVVTKLSTHLNLSPSMGAVTLLSLGNGAPDVFASVAAVRGGHARTGLGAILSAGTFVSAFVVGFVAIYAAPFSVDPAPFVRDVFFYLIAALSLFYVYLSAEIFLWQAIGFVGFYVFFVGFVFWMDVGVGGGRGEDGMGLIREVKKGFKVPDCENGEGLGNVEAGKPSFGFYGVLRKLKLKRPTRESISQSSKFLRNCGSRQPLPFPLKVAVHQDLFVSHNTGTGLLENAMQRGESSYHRKKTVILDHCVIGRQNVISWKCLSPKYPNGGAAAMARDHDKDLLAYRCDTFICNLQLMAEAIALSLDAHLAQAYQWHDVVLESDALSLIQMLNTPSGIFHSEISRVWEVPVSILLKLTIPQPAPSEWSRFYLSANIALCPLALLYSCSSFMSLNHQIVFLLPHSHFPLWLVVLFASSSLALVHYIMEKEPPVTEQMPVVLIAFVMSVFWISTVAGELLDCLAAVGAILELPPALLGLTVLAWGNSVGDLVADVAVAKAGQPAMAMAGCFAGPMFNMLVGLGTALVMQTSDLYPQAYELRFHLSIVVAFGFLLLSLMGSLLVVTLFRFRVPRSEDQFALYLHSGDRDQVDRSDHPAKRGVNMAGSV